MNTAAVPHVSTPSPAHRSPWHSPVPYLFGGLAAMLGLIALALIVLACSYWNVAGNPDGDQEPGDRDLEVGDEKPKLPPAIWEEKVLVIMAGQEKPTFLATPISSRASSFGSNSSGGGEMPGKSSGEGDRRETAKQGSQSDQVQVSVVESREASDHDR